MNTQKNNNHSYGWKHLTAIVALVFLPSLALAGPPPKECASDNDCDGGMTCNDNWCGYEDECQTNADCNELHGPGFECMGAGCGGMVCVESIEEPECEFDADCGECGLCNEGYCALDMFMAFQCESNADCASNEKCLKVSCSSSCRVLNDAELCEKNGGTWNDCASGSCPTCTDCIGACDYSQATPEQVCASNGGTWNECASSSCPECDDCIGACIYPQVTPVEACASNGGTWNECAHGSCPMCLDCVAACVYPIEKLIQMCEDSGGAWDECGTSSCPECDDCMPACVCPEGRTAAGTVCTPIINPESKNPEDGKSTSSDGAGCSTTGQGTAPTVPFALLLLSVFLLRRRFALNR